MNRSINARLTLKTVSEDARIIEGVASTGRADRGRDIVEPLGAEFQLPIPFMLDHDHLLAVGEVDAAEVTADAIRFRAHIKKIAEPGQAKDLVDYAWSLLRAGLRKTVSIGFMPIDYEALPSGGLRFTAWEWLELSAVAVPMNADANITGLKGAGRLTVPRAPLVTRQVRLTAAEMRRAKIEASIKAMSDRNRRLGIPNVVVKL